MKKLPFIYRICKQDISIRTPEGTKTGLIEAIRVIDADTFEIYIDHGKYVYSKEKVRLEGLDMPEKSSSNPLEVNTAIKLTSWVQKWFDTYNPDWLVSLNKPEKYGRMLANAGNEIYISDILSGFITLSADKSISLTDSIEKLGIKRIYQGKKKIPWIDDDLQKIIQIIDTELSK